MPYTVQEEEKTNPLQHQQPPQLPTFISKQTPFSSTSTRHLKRRLSSNAAAAAVATTTPMMMSSSPKATTIFESPNFDDSHSLSFQENVLKQLSQISARLDGLEERRSLRRYTSNAERSSLSGQQSPIL